MNPPLRRRYVPQSLTTALCQAKLEEDTFWLLSHLLEATVHRKYRVVDGRFNEMHRVGKGFVGVLQVR